MTTPNTLNGVDVDALNETFKVVEKDPKVAKFRFKANNKWMNGGHNRTEINEFYGACDTHLRAKPFVFDKDEPPVLLGTDKGANPVEYVLAALAGCLTTSLIYHAAARGYKINEVESSFVGDLDLRGFLGLDDNVRNGYEKIKVMFKVDGDIPDDVLMEIVQIAQQRSPVYDIVTNGVPVDVELEK